MPAQQAGHGYHARQQGQGEQGGDQHLMQGASRLLSFLLLPRLQLLLTGGDAATHLLGTKSQGDYLITHRGRAQGAG